MKKSIILALTMSGVLMFSSCEKDKEPITNTATNQTVSTTQMTDEQVEAKIIDFIAKVESGDKSTEDMNIEDAVWNIEAALNYTFCVNEVDLVKDSEETIEYNIDNKGSIDFSTISEIYYYLKTKTKELKSKNQYISAIDINNNEGVVSFIISIPENKKSIDNIKSTDYWYGESYGTCDGTGTTDASDYLQNRITFLHFTFQAGTYWTGQDNHILTPVVYIPNTMDNNLDKIPFERQKIYGDNWGYCISQTQLNYYETKYWNRMCSTIPSNKKPYNWHHKGIRWRRGNIGQYNEVIDHTIDYYFGEQHIAGPK